MRDLFLNLGGLEVLLTLVNVLAGEAFLPIYIGIADAEQRKELIANILKRFFQIQLGL